MSKSAVSRAVARGEKVANDKAEKLMEEQKRRKTTPSPYWRETNEMYAQGISGNIH